MSPISFIFYFHSSRTDNLSQALRLLATNEGEWLKQNEIILICHDQVPDALPTSAFKSVTQISLGMESYNKPVMCNLGVRLATNPIIALLDSDRVVGPGYFRDQTELLVPGTAITPLFLLSLAHSYTDDEIQDGKFTAKGDFRCSLNHFRRKNGFSGNTLMFREDYLGCGGMDESYIGYGFADNDMVATFEKSGRKITFNNSMELHLYHDEKICMGGRFIERSEFQVYTLENGLRFCKKWWKSPGFMLRDLYLMIKANPPVGGPAHDLWIRIRNEIAMLD